MKLGKFTDRSVIPMPTPRWHDRVALPMDSKLKTHNVLKFTAKNKNGDLYFDNEYYISLKDAQSYPTETKHTKQGYPYLVRVIPLDDLEPFEGDL